MAFGIPTVPASAPVEAAPPEAALVREALATIDALQKLAQFKPFTGWFMGRLGERVEQLETEILEGDLSAEEIMKRRERRREVKHLMDMLKAEHGRALQVLEQQQMHAAAKQQVRDTGPKMTTMATPNFDGTKPGEEPVTVGGLVKEFEGMFTVFGRGAPQGPSQPANPAP